MWGTLDELTADLGLDEANSYEAARKQVVDWLRVNKETAPEADRYVGALSWLDVRIAQPRTVATRGRTALVGPTVSPLATSASPSRRAHARHRRRKVRLGGISVGGLAAMLWAVSNPENSALNWLSPLVESDRPTYSDTLPKKIISINDERVVFLQLVPLASYALVASVLALVWRRQRKEERALEDFETALMSRSVQQLSLADLEDELSGSGATADQVAESLLRRAVDLQLSWSRHRYRLGLPPVMATLRQWLLRGPLVPVDAPQIAVEAAEAMLDQYVRIGLLEIVRTRGGINYRWIP